MIWEFFKILKIRLPHDSLSPIVYITKGKEIRNIRETFALLCHSSTDQKMEYFGI